MDISKRVRRIKRKINFKILALVLIAILIPLGSLFIRNRIIDSNKESIEDYNQTINQGVSNNVDLPANFPPDFPIYQDSVLVASEVNKDELEGMSAIWETSSTIEKVSAFYTSQLLIKGWKYEVVVQNKNITSLTFIRDNISGFMAIAPGENNKVVITVGLGLK